MGQTDSCHNFETRAGADAQGGSTGCRLDERFRQFYSASLQEAGQQELFEHFPAFVDSAPLQHPAVGRGRPDRQTLQGHRNGEGLQVFPQGPQDGAAADGDRRGGRRRSD